MAYRSLTAGCCGDGIHCCLLGARLVIQFVYFDRTDAPTGMPFRIAEVAFVGLFVFLTLTYGYAAAMNVWETHR